MLHCLLWRRRQRLAACVCLPLAAKAAPLASRPPPRRTHSPRSKHRLRCQNMALITSAGRRQQQLMMTQRGPPSGRGAGAGRPGPAQRSRQRDCRFCCTPRLPVAGVFNSDGEVGYSKMTASPCCQASTAGVGRPGEHSPFRRLYPLPVIGLAFSFHCLSLSVHCLS